MSGLSLGGALSRGFASYSRQHKPSGHKLEYYTIPCTLISYEERNLSADEDLIEQARLVARAQHKTLNAAFREWLVQYAAQSGNAQEVDSLMDRLRHVRAGGRFSRDQMNER